MKSKVWEEERVKSEFLIRHRIIICLFLLLLLQSLYLQMLIVAVCLSYYLVLLLDVSLFLVKMFFQIYFVCSCKLMKNGLFCQSDKIREAIGKYLSIIVVILEQNCRFGPESRKQDVLCFLVIKWLTNVVSMTKNSCVRIWTSSVPVSFSITQLSTTSSSRAAFLQCLRWGIWCPFQEPADWKGEEIQLVLQGGAKPNPHGVMVYSTEMSAKTPSSAPLSAPGTAQVTQQHRGEKCKEYAERCYDMVLFSASFSSYTDVSLRSENFHII